VSDVRRLAEDDLALIQPLFAEVFGAPISLEMLQWKYGDGRGVAWTLWNKDVLLLHCGVCQREVLLQGERVRVAQLVDLMAAPKQAGLSLRTSPFAVLMRHILEQLPGPENPDGIAFGFPSARAMRLGEHTGVYCAVDQWVGLEFEAQEVQIGPRAREISSWGWREVNAVNTLWFAMQAGLESYVVGVRDMLYLRHRYLEHPDKKYRVLLVESRWRRLPMGMLVISPNNSEIELLDVICAWQDMPDVLLAGSRWLHSLNAQSMTLNLTSHFAYQLTALAANCNDTQFRIMANPRSPGPTLKKLERRWWLTGGDTDYR
jgi:hypothetical protein